MVAEAHGNRTVAKSACDGKIRDQLVTRDHVRPRRLTLAFSAGLPGSPEIPQENNPATRVQIYRLAEAFKRAVSRDDLGTAERIWRAIAERLPNLRPAEAHVSSCR